jgi:hypothetical protein
MVTIYTERGPAGEVLLEKKEFHFGRLAITALVTACLLSLIALYNLNKDVKDLTQNKLPSLQLQIAMDSAVQR